MGIKIDYKEISPLEKSAGIGDENELRWKSNSKMVAALEKSIKELDKSMEKMYDNGSSHVVKFPVRVEGKWLDEELVDYKGRKVIFNE